MSDAILNESTFRYGPNHLAFDASEFDSIQDAWNDVAEDNGIDTSRTMVFKSGADVVEGGALPVAGRIYTAEVTKSKNGS